MGSEHSADRSAVATGDIVTTLLDTEGRTFAEEAGIRLERNTPTPLFRLLCLALLSSARISADIAMDAAKALADDGQTSPQKLLDATWKHRTSVLNKAGYARYDESTSRYLADTAELLLNRYAGDLRNLRERAARDPEQEHRRLTEFKGIGDAGASMFLREVQLVWNEVEPYLDDRARQSAEALDLPVDPTQLRRQVETSKEFTRLVAALVRSSLHGDIDRILEDAAH